MKRPRTAVTTVALTALLAGCGIPDPYRHTPPRPAPPTAPEQNATSAQTSSPSPATTARRFALAVTTDPASRLARDLATPGLARTLVSAGGQARLEAGSEHGRWKARLLSLSLHGKGTTRTGVVVVSLQPVIAGHATGAAVASVFLIALERKRGGWRVSGWVPQP